MVLIMTTTKTILLAGATGNLGALIAGALQRIPGVTLRCLIRPGSRDKAAALAQAGAEIVEVDLADDAAMRRACEGVFAVVSALQGGPDVIIDAQLRLLRAARAAGARRFIPSDYSLNFFGLAEGDNINSDWRRAFARAAEAERGAVEVVHVLNGCFLDRKVLFGFLGMFDLAAGKAFLWGDGATPMDFTTYADTALYTAEAATQDETPPAEFNIAGDTLDFNGLVQAYTKGSGNELTVERRGSLADLDREIDRRRATEPQNVVAWLPLMYLRGMLNGTGALGPLVNDRYPHISPTSVAAYVRSEYKGMTTPQSERFPDWETLYRQQPGETLPWYYADLDPDLEAALRDHGLTRGRLLDLGTGPGTQAIALATRGFEATGTDLSATAVAKATELAQARGVRVSFVQDDVLASRLTGSFDAVFDRGCFHVIDPARRGAYVDAVAGWLAPGGLLLLKTFSKLQPDGPGPHRFSPDELRTTFAPRFELLSATETVYQGTLDPLPKALFSVLRLSARCTSASRHRRAVAG